MDLPVTNGISSQKISNEGSALLLCCWLQQAVEQSVLLTVIWDPGAHETSLKCGAMDTPATTNTHRQNMHHHIFKLQDQPTNHAVYIVTENQYTINQDSEVMSFEYDMFVEFL